MIRLNKVVLGLSFSLMFGLLLAPAQNKNGALSPSASLSETIAWLKAHIPYNYVVPMNKERAVLQRETIAHFQANGCTVSYEITTETLTTGSSPSGDPRGFTQERWRIDLVGLNPETIRVQAAKGEHPARLVFSSFDLHAALNKIDPAKAVVLPVEPAKVIWHSTRNEGYRDRNGEGFVSWGSFSVRDEIRGQAIADALRRSIGLCRDMKRG